MIDTEKQLNRPADRHRVIFVDDDPSASSLFQRFCEGTAYQCEAFQSPLAAMESFQEKGADIIVSDLQMPELDGVELLSRIRKIDSAVPFILVTAFSTVDDAIEALRLGATDFLKKPFDMDELMLLMDNALGREKLKRENVVLKRQLRMRLGDDSLLGESDAMQEVQNVINKVAGVRCNVIIEGESGTGKELVARSIHNRGPAPDNPFVVIDCGALTETLLESELFGHERGAFTGAQSTKPGLVELASGGTLFLDEIGNISQAMQVKLLRVIQEQEVMRVGGVRRIPIDVRFLAATNENLEQMIQNGDFRADLYHRLNVVKIIMPPLRDRAADIQMLAMHFVDEFANKYNRGIQRITPEGVKRLLAYDWPGNIRELKNVVEREVVLAEGAELTMEHINPYLSDRQGLDADQPTLAELERRYIEKLLRQFNDNRSKTAEVLGIDKSTLWRKLQTYSNH